MNNSIHDFEHQLMLTSFSLACHSLRLLGKAGLMDEDTRSVIRHHLQLLETKIVAMPDPQHRDFFHTFLDVLTGVLPPTSGDGSKGAE